jgi:acylphosphatase
VRTGGPYYGESIGEEARKVNLSGTVDNISDGVTLNIEILIGGVTFDDGSIQKTILSNNGLDQNGVFALTFHKTSKFGSNCYRMRLWQGNIPIAYYH